MSGSGGDGGYDYQADAGFAYVATHVLCGQPLSWFEDFDDTPLAVSSETGGPGDDLAIETQSGFSIEVQSKRGLERGKKFDDTVRRLIIGLVRNPDLRCVLLVNSTTSGTIREDFRNDVLRLGDGRTDELKEITKSVLSLFEPADNVSPAIFRRFRIVEWQTEAASAVCMALLRQVVENPAQTETAWDLLGKDGHRQMSRRGRRDAETLSRLLGTHLPLKRDASNLVVAAEAYRLWQVKAYGQFFVPGIGVALPIDQAWTVLRVLGDEPSKPRLNNSISKMVQAYHEWERLADNPTNGDRREAEHLLAFDEHVVVLGGPGSGKSTLADRIVWRAASEGRRVIKVRLRIVAKGMRGGQGFDQALKADAADTSGLTPKLAEQLLTSPEVLIADGLDETDPSRADVARALVSWCAGHPNCRVCVLTRPVGHEPGLLPGFRHVELLPLERTAIRKHSLVLFRGRLSEDDAIQRWRDFLSLVEDSKGKHRAASLAARNPLLLGFLVRLVADGVAVGTNRAALYGQVVQLVRTSKVVDREVSPEVEEAVANRIVDVLGWLVTRQPDISRTEAVQEIGRDLVRQLVLPQLKAAQEAERVLRYWEDRRLIECLTAGHQEVLVFVHPSLGEFAAARYAATLTDTEIDTWIEEVRTAPRWRQVVLLAVGLGQASRIVRKLVSLDRQDDPNSTEVILAAAAQEEVPMSDPSLALEVTNRLSARLTSPIPLIAIEAALAIRPLTPYIPERIGSVASALIDHPQLWTHLAGVALALEAGPDLISISQVQTFLETPVPAPGFLFRNHAPSQNPLPEEASELINVALENSLARLFRDLPLAEASHRAESLAMSEKSTIRIQELVTNLLERYGQKEAIDRIRQRWLSPEFEGFVRFLSSGRFHVASVAFLDAVLWATGRLRQPVTSTNDRPLLHLAAVYHTMGFNQVPIGDWIVLGRRKAEEVVAEVVRAVTAALGLEPQTVGEEANEAFGRLGEDGALYNILPSVSAEPDWPRRVKAGIDLSLIGQGLFHPCIAIIITSAYVLSQDGGSPGVRDFVGRALTNGGESTLRVTAHIIKPVWGVEAVSVLLTRLRQPLTPGCEHLYTPLVELAQPADFGLVREALLSGIGHESPSIAKAAAEALLLKSDLVGGANAARIAEMLAHWTRRGSWCDHCQVAVFGSSCPSCHIVPPNPRAALVKKLIDLEVVTQDRLLSLCRDENHDVAKEARKGLVMIATSNEVTFRQLIDGIGAEEVPVQVLDELLTLPTDLLRCHIEAISALAGSSSVPVRLSLLKSLPSGWADHSLADTISQAGLRDPDPAIRSQATRSVRSLSQ